jgi:hypothetical protein
MSKFFNDLMQSVQEMDEIIRGEREPSRRFEMDKSDSMDIKNGPATPTRTNEPDKGLVQDNQ